MDMPVLTLAQALLRAGSGSAARALSRVPDAGASFAADIWSRCLVLIWRSADLGHLPVRLTVSRWRHGTDLAARAPSHVLVDSGSYAAERFCLCLLMLAVLASYPAASSPWPLMLPLYMAPEMAVIR